MYDEIKQASSRNIWYYTLFMEICISSQILNNLYNYGSFQEFYLHPQNGQKHEESFTFKQEGEGKEATRQIILKATSNFTPHSNPLTPLKW